MEGVLVDVFIHVPDHQAGDPILLETAVSNIAVLAALPFAELIFQFGDTSRPVEMGAWMLMLSSLRSGVPAFVQMPVSHRWAKIPIGYWTAYSDSDPIPAIFQGMEGATGVEQEMSGQPIVVWSGAEWHAMNFAAQLIERFRESAKNGGRVPDASLLTSGTLEFLSSPQKVVRLITSADRFNECKRLAKIFDERGMSQKDVKAPVVAAEWSLACEPDPVGNVHSEMTKKRPGVKPRNPTQ